MTAVLEIEQVARTYGSGHTQVRALDGVSLTVEPGELVAVMGPSGAGKSTLLHLAGGLDRPTGGTIRVVGTDLGGLGRSALAALRRRRVGYVFQELNLIFWPILGPLQVDFSAPSTLPGSVPVGVP